MKVAVSQVEHYAYRDSALHDIAFDEFVMAFRLEKVPKGNMESVNADHPAAGRPRSQAYRLLEPHPLHDSYVLREKVKFDIPVFVGDPPPRLPSAKQRSVTQSSTKSRDHATYYATLFIPWHADGDIPWQPGGEVAAWHAHMRTLEEQALATNQDEVGKLEAAIANGRLWRIRQVANALISDSSKAVLMSKWRNRDRTCWNPDALKKKAHDENTTPDAGDLSLIHISEPTRPY